MADDSHTHQWRLIASYWDDQRNLYVIGEVCDKQGCSETRERTSTTHP